MKSYSLIIGNLNYSSWSLRAWIGAVHLGCDFDEVRIPLFQDDWQDRIAKYSAAGKVPVLRHGAVTIHDSLAILEYLAERFPDRRMWPEDAEARARARSVSAEMHAGFVPLRSNMPMNMRSSYPGKGRGDGVAQDIERITAIWRDCRERFGGGGDFLFGAFGNADAMFAPVVSRFRTYAVDVDPVSSRYMEAVLALPAMRAAQKSAEAEPWTLPRYEFD